VRAEPGHLIATGREADVFEAGPGLVLRRYRARLGSDHEVRAMQVAYDAGFPVPKVHDFDGADLVMERIDGRTMLADMRVRPWRYRMYARALGQLHEQLHAIKAPADLPERLTGGGDTFIHGDLHPENVVLSRRGPVVIDWPNAGRGLAQADIAYTWIILATSEIPGRGVVMPALMRFLRDDFTGVFLRRFNHDDLVRVLPALAEHRLADRNVLRAEAEQVRALVARAGGAAG
jgi:Ser/Thr protein kinase RdoA (MazF antagonist)